MTNYPLDVVHYGDSFGRRYIDGKWQMHAGQDFKGVPVGEHIYAVLDGIVRFAGWNNTYGNCVIITHFNGYETLYAHMVNTPYVKSGEKVDISTVLGGVGNTGFSFGRHLHFAVFYGKFIFGNISNAVEPLNWLNKYCKNERFLMALNNSEQEEMLSILRALRTSFTDKDASAYDGKYAKADVAISHVNQLYSAILDKDPNAYKGEYRKFDILYSHVNQMFSEVQNLKTILENILKNVGKVDNG